MRGPQAATGRGRERAARWRWGPTGLAAIERGVVAGLLLLIAVAWLGFVHVSVGVTGSGSPSSLHAGHHMAATGGAALLAAFLMWTAMMIGMMLPASTPTILTLVSLLGARDPELVLPTIRGFVAGYLAAWTAFSAGAAFVQWTLASLAALTPAGAITSPGAGAAVLIGAGLFQLTPFKSACLSRCRTPIGFLMAEWRPGSRGALVMGLRYGANCVACCWALMAVMLVVGVMNLGWMLALTVLMLFEKIAPAPQRIGRLVGAALIAWGLAVFAGVVG